jgi:hypothetical protein
MGWLHGHDERGDHEGFVVAYVPRDWVPTLSAIEIGSARLVAIVPHSSISGGPWRELGVHPLDREHVIRGFSLVGAACECGWRSPRRNALGTGAAWAPSYVERSEPLEQSLCKLWREHVELECGR